MLGINASIEVGSGLPEASDEEEVVNAVGAR